MEMLLFFMAVLLCIDRCCCQSQLQFAQMLCRHGDRSPAHFYPNYLHKQAWPLGEGQLTPEGMRQHFANGEFVRARYGQLLDQTYFWNQTIVRSSDIDRCIQSAESLLSALYPPQGEYQFNSDIKWQPIPVHSISPEVDYYLQGTDCPALVEAMIQCSHTPEYQQLIKDATELTEYVCPKAGFAIPGEHCISPVAGCFVADIVHNLSLPDWATPEIVSEIFDTKNRFEALQAKYEPINILAPGGGPLLEVMMKEIEDRVADDSTKVKHKFIMYSAHDSTILPFWGNLGLFNGLHPPYASCALVELHQETKSKEWFVELYYKNETGSDPDNLYSMTMEGCPSHSCPLRTFSALVADKRTPDPAAACHLTCPLTRRFSFNFIVTSFMAVIICGLLILNVTLLLSRKSLRKSSPYVKASVKENNGYDYDDTPAVAF